MDIPAIKTDKLTKKYGERTAVDALDLSVAPGELFALLGVNGAGKTTTIKLLCCLLTPTSGGASILGHSVTAEQEQVKQLINISPQETAVARNLTVRENLTLTAKLYGFSAQKAAERSDELIALLGLGEYANSRAKTLSGGTGRRLSIAMALVSEPKVLFLDEPTLGLDVLARRELWKLIQGLKGNTTVVLTTHYLEEAEALSDRIGIMSHGRLAACGTAEQLKAAAGSENFEDAFVALAGGEKE